MKHKDVIFFSTLGVWVVFILVIILGGEALGIEPWIHFCSVANWHSYSS